MAATVIKRAPRAPRPLPLLPASACQDALCGHPFHQHFAAGLGLLSSGPCKLKGCPCRKFVPLMPRG